jgi:hypothetical protein
MCVPVCSNEFAGPAPVRRRDVVQYNVDVLALGAADAP